MRIAIVDNGTLSEFHLQRPTEKGLIGNIYKGKVVRVLPGMQAAFVNIGLERTGFLYVDDVYLSQNELDQSILNREQEGADRSKPYFFFGGSTNLGINTMCFKKRGIILI